MILLFFIGVLGLLLLLVCIYIYIYIYIYICSKFLQKYRKIDKNIEKCIEINYVYFYLFSIFDFVPFSPSFFFFFFFFFFFSVGNLAVSHFVKKYKKQSYIAFLLCVCTVLSAVLMSAMTIYDIVTGQESMRFVYTYIFLFLSKKRQKKYM